MRATGRARPQRRGGTVGTALPTALLVLVVLTLLGTAAVFTASTELDIAGNGRREVQALSVAEAGIHEALARLNVRNPGVASRIVPGETSPGVPNPTWSVTIVQGTAGASQVRTLTAGADPESELPISTTTRYKTEEAGEAPVEHCNGGCNANEVVRFHTDYDYIGSNVPGPGKVGPPVIRLESTYDEDAKKVLVVEAVRSLTQAKTAGTVRACGTVECGGSNQTNGTGHPEGFAVVGGTGVGAGCDAGRVEPDGGTKVEACPADLFAATFGMSKSDMKEIADIVAAGPYATPPGGTKGKIIWITGDTASTTWQGNPMLGTAQEPVIVVVEGNFRVQGTLQLFGMVYVMGNMEFGSGNLSINGAIVVEKDSTTNLTGNSTITYNPNVLDNLNKLSPFTTILWKVN